MGLEPTTSTLRVRRATHCATLPRKRFFVYQHVNHQFHYYTRNYYSKRILPVYWMTNEIFGAVIIFQ